MTTTFEQLQLFVIDSQFCIPSPWRVGRYQWRVNRDGRLSYWLNYVVAIRRIKRWLDCVNVRTVFSQWQRKWSSPSMCNYLSTHKQQNALQLTTDIEIALFSCFITLWLFSWSFEKLSFYNTKMLGPIKRITLLYMITIMITSNQKIFSKNGSNSMISKICPTRCTAVHTWQRLSNKSWNSRHPWYLVMRFCSQDISEFSVMPNAAQGESYYFMPGRMVYLWHFETLELWEPWNLFKEWPSRATLDALGYVHTVQDRFLLRYSVNKN